MSEKFDLDSIKNLLESVSSGDDSSFSLDDIMKDFGKTSSASEENDAVVDIDENPSILDESLDDEHVIEQIVEPKSVKKSSDTAVSDSPIDEEIKKPDGYSLTGAFDAIRNEKQNDNNFQIVEENDDEQYDSSMQSEDETDNKEIFADIEHKRFFNTDTFNSIKDKSSASIKDSLTSFTHGQDDEADDGEEEFFKPHEPTEEIDDFEEQEDREDIVSELKKINSSASLRTLFTFVFAVISGLLFAVSNSWIALPGVDFQSDFKVFTIILTAVSFLATVVNYNSVINGVKSLIKLKFSTETYIFLIFIFNTALNFTYLFDLHSDSIAVVSFDFIYVLHVFFNIFSKKLIAKTVYKNFLIASSDGQKNIIDDPASEEAVNDIMLETGCTSDIVYVSKTELVSDFIAKSFKDFDRTDTLLATELAIIVVVLAVVNFFVKGGLSSALIYSVGALCATMPILLSYSVSAPLYYNSNKTRKQGGVIVGSQACNKLKDVQTLIVDDSDVFNTSLNGIRLYGDSSIDDAILYLNALYNKVGGPLSKLFSDMLSEDITSLPRVDEIYYHDTMGYSGLIHSKVFVVGNKSLMDHFGVEVDDSEYEIIYQQKSKHVLFVAYDGKLMGVFLLSYSLSHGVAKAFRICEKNQIAVCIVERDAGVNSKTLFDSYTPKEKVLFNFISFRTARKCFEKFELRTKSSANLISRTGVKGLAAALHSCKTMHFAFKMNKVISAMSSVIAVLLISFLLFFSDPSSNLSVHILAYQMLWSLPILFVSLFSK